jgi:hypothetical protein
MRQQLIITIGILLVLLAVGTWVYLFIYGAPKGTQEVFTNLGFLSADLEQTASSTQGAPEDTMPLALSGARLEQLSTRSVAGAVFMGSTTIRYAERGTGYIYDIDLTSGTEKQVSLTTFAQTSAAVFSEDGASVALISYGVGAAAIRAGKIDVTTSSLSTETLPQNAHDVDFRDADHVRFATSDETSTTGYIYDLTQHTAEKLFSVPLRQVAIIWDGPYVYTLPSAENTGYLYAVQSGALQAVPLSGKDLSAFLIDGKLAVSMATDDQYGSFLYDPKTGLAQQQAIALLGEKCARHTQEDTLWCAAPLSPDASMLEEWYKGTYRSRDFFWKVDLSHATAEVSDDLNSLAGRDLDVAQLWSDASGDALIFIDKNDQSLWIFRVNQ